MSLGSYDSDIPEFVLRGMHSCLKLQDTLIQSEIQKEFYEPEEFTFYLSVLCNQPPTNKFQTFGTSNCQAQIAKYKQVVLLQSQAQKN